MQMLPRLIALSRCCDSYSEVGSLREPGNGFWGDWGAVRYCPYVEGRRTYACGAKGRVDPRNGGDDTALNGLYLDCCSRT